MWWRASKFKEPSFFFGYSGDRGNTYQKQDNLVGTAGYAGLVDDAGHIFYYKEPYQQNLASK